MNVSRRNFFSSLALGVSAKSFPEFFENFQNLKEVKQKTIFDHEELNKWFKKIKGEHRVVYDGSEPHNTLNCLELGFFTFQ